MFRRKRQNQELIDQKQRYTEQERQAEQAHVAFFTEVDHLRDVCSLLLNNLPNCCIRIDQMSYNITRLRDDGPTRLLISDGQQFIDCSFDMDTVDIAEGERQKGQQAIYATQHIANRDRPVTQASAVVAAYTERFSGLQDELLIAAGYLDLLSDKADSSGAVGHVAVQAIAA